jgi:hypothetical protein
MCERFLDTTEILRGRSEPSANVDDVAGTPARRNQGFRGCLRDRGRMGPEVLDMAIMDKVHADISPRTSACFVTELRSQSIERAKFPSRKVAFFI